MYNMEKYIGECLDSILAQTFTDYEVIIVDDCSTDKSCEIVENYLPKGNFKLIRSEKNSGGHVGVPRNKGIKIAKGEYLYFVDSDDALTNDALEKLYDVAEKYQADVVHCDRYLQSPEDTALTDRKFLNEINPHNAEKISAPYLIQSDLDYKLNYFFNLKFSWEPWNHIVRRKFMEDNGIKFPELLSISDDLMFSLTVFLTAENIVVMPNAFYVWRKTETSNSRKKYQPLREIQKVGGDMIHGISFIENFCRKRKLFEDNPVKKILICHSLLEWNLTRTSPPYLESALYELDKTIRIEIEKVEDKTTVAAIFFGYINLMKLSLDKRQNKIDNLNAEFSKLKPLYDEQQKKINMLEDENFNLRKLSRNMIELANYHAVESQNLKSLLDTESTETFLKLVGK